jgi:hypothetical protein
MAMSKSLESKLKKKAIKLQDLETKVLKLKASMAKIKSQLRTEVMALPTSSDDSSSSDDSVSATDVVAVGGATAAIGDVDAATTAASGEADAGTVVALIVATVGGSRGRARVIPLGQCPKCWKEASGMPGGVHTYSDNCTGVRKRRPNKTK